MTENKAELYACQLKQWKDGESVVWQKIIPHSL